MHGVRAPSLSYVVVADRPAGNLSLLYGVRVSATYSSLETAANAALSAVTAD